MTEPFMDTSNILGVLPRETVPAENAVEKQDQVDTENSNESDDSGQDQAGLDASDDDSISADDTDDSGDEGQQDDQGSDPEGLKEKLEATELERRDWQSKAMSSDADLGKALDLLGSSGGSNGTQAAPSQPPVSKVMEKLDAMDSEEVVDASTMKGLFTDFMAEQQADRNTAQQKSQMDDFNSNMSTQLRGYSDLKEVTAFYNEHLTGRPEVRFLTDLGRYQFGKAEMLEAKTKEVFNKGKAEGAKGAVGRTERLRKLPGTTGAQGERLSVENDPSGVVNHMQQRRQARGIRPDGSIR